MGERLDELDGLVPDEFKGLIHFEYDHMYDTISLFFENDRMHIVHNASGRKRPRVTRESLGYLVQEIVEPLVAPFEYVIEDFTENMNTLKHSVCKVYEWRIKNEK